MDDSEWTMHTSLQSVKRTWKKKKKEERQFDSLRNAVEANDFKKAEHILEDLLHWSQVSPNERLIDACKHGDLNMVEFLITNSAHPADVNAGFLIPNSVHSADVKSETRQTRPIWEAIEAENLELLQLLLHKASMKVDLECKMYFSRYRSPWTFKKDFMLTPLTRTIELGNFEIAQELILAGADVNARIITTNSTAPTELTMPPIMVAAKGFYLDICCLLLKHGCDVTANQRSAVQAVPFYRYFRALDIAAKYADNYSRQLLGKDPDTGYAVVKLLLKHMPKNDFSAAMEMFLSSYSREGINKKMNMNQAAVKGMRLLLEQGYKWQVHWHPKQWKDELMQIIHLPHLQPCFTIMLEYGYKVSSSSDHFCSAVKKGLVGLIYSMLEVNPQCLQQKWLNDYQDFGELPERAVVWLLAKRKQPVSLQHLCKARIWQHLASLSDHHNHQVHIPTLIEEQISLPLMLKRNLRLLSISNAREMILDDTQV